MVVQISALDLTDWAEGQTWKLIDWSNIGPGSVSHENVTLETENFGDLMLVQTFTADGYYVTAVIPEPSRAVLLVMAVGALVLRRKRRAGSRVTGRAA
jgi:hypothetical protein